MSEIITVIGNIATEPQQRPVGGGAFVTSFRVAATERRFDRESNKWVDSYTSFYSVSAFRSLGIHAFASLHKGERVIVTGRLRVKEWDNGTKQGTTAEIDADAVGHDLLWGVSHFDRAGAPTVSEPSGGPALQQAPAEPEGVRAATDADGWTIPAVAPVEQAEAPQPVGAGAGEVPF